MKKILLLFLILATVAILTNSPADGETPPRQWAYVLHSQPPGEALRSMAMEAFSVLCVTGFTLDRSGALSTGGSSLLKSFLEEARSGKTRVYPMITFSAPESGMALLSSPAARSMAVGAIAGLVKKTGVPGIHLDFEYLTGRYAPKLALFIGELRSAMPGLTITMAVFPSVAFPEKWSSFHDLSLLAPLLDEIVLMCYDYHRADTLPGPVTDLAWAEKNIAAALRYARPGQLWLGVPAYGYAWPSRGRARVITEREGLRLAEKYGSERHGSGTLFLKRGKDGAPVQAWFADGETRRRLAGIAARYGLRGTALWRLGFGEIP